MKYVDSLITDISPGTTGFFAATARLAGNDGVADDLTKQASDGIIPSMTTADIQYTYSFGEMGILRGSAVSLGIMNFTNEEAPAIGLVTAYDGTLHDGRVWFCDAACDPKNNEGLVPETFQLRSAVSHSVRVLRSPVLKRR